MGDFNATIGQRQQHEKKVGIYGFGPRNKRGSKLLEFAEKESMSIMNTFFKKRTARKWTWKSPSGTKHELDYILSNNRSIFLDCSVINH